MERQYEAVQAPYGTPDWLAMFTATERPDLWELAVSGRVFERVWPEYNLHGNDTPRYFGALFPRFADLQAIFVDKRSGRLVGRARTIPFRWDRTLVDLPLGIDALGLRAISETEKPTALSALAAEVDPDFQGLGLSELLLKTISVIARSAGLSPLVAPVRPSWKDRHPFVPIERYAGWQRADGLPFDPWIRVHHRLGGTVLRCEPRSMRIFAPVADWEAWTGTRFHQEGPHIFPGGLAPLTISRGMGEYFEPNVWMLHLLD
jgi:GNAT superfamily N-acetyltransferase